MRKWYWILLISLLSNVVTARTVYINIYDTTSKTGISGVTFSFSDGLTPTITETTCPPRIGVCYTFTVPDSWAGNITPFNNPDTLFSPTYKNISAGSPTLIFAFVGSKRYYLRGSINVQIPNVGVYGLNNAEVKFSLVPPAIGDTVGTVYNGNQYFLKFYKGWKGTIRFSRNGYVFNPPYKDFFDQNITNNNANVIYNSPAATDTAAPVLYLKTPLGSNHSLGIYDTIETSVIDNSEKIKQYSYQISYDNGVNWNTTRTDIKTDYETDFFYANDTSWTECKRKIPFKPENLSNNCRIRTIAQDFSLNSDTVQSSSFSVIDTTPTVTLNYPTGGEVWDTNTAYNITWIASDDSSITRWKACLDNDSIIGGPGNPQSSSWKPTAAYLGNHTLKIAVYDAGNRTRNSISGSFIIRDPKPTLLQPKNDSTNTPINIRLSWNPITAAGSYTVQVSTTSSTNTYTTSNPYQDIVGLNNSTVHNWKVRITSNSTWSETRNFTTIIAAPAKPILTTPINDAPNQSIAPTLSWTTTGATTCTLQVSRNANMSSNTAYPTTTLSKAVSGLLNSTKYYWRVKAVNIGGTSPWSDTDSFTTIVINPTVPTLTSPADGATEQLFTPTLTWTKPSEAASCSVQVSISSGFTTISEAGKTTGNSYIPPALQKNTTYYWRVCAINVAGTSLWSDTFNFKTTFDAPTISTNLQITPNLHSGSQATISWTASAINNDLTTQNISWSTDGANFTVLSNTTHTGSYEWTIPTNFASNTCRIRVQVVDGSGKSATITSDPFTVTDTIPPTTPIVTIPGDVCYTGRPFIITWTEVDNIGITARKVTLYDGSIVDGGSGTYTWTAPQKLMTGKFGIRVYDAAGNSSYAESGSFTVKDTTKPVLTLNSIDTSVSVGSKHPLTWTCSDNLGTVSVAIYLVNGTTTRLDSITGTSYEWTAPMAGRYHFLLRAYDGSGNKTEATSKEFTTNLTTEIRAYARAIPKQLELQLVKGMAILGVDKSEMTTFRVLDTKGRVLVNYRTSEVGYHTVSMDRTVSGRYIAILSRAGKQVLRPVILF
jgi:hypothetical protein